MSYSLDEERGLDQMEWSEDGQLLAVATAKGNLHIYLSKLPLLGSAFQSRYCHKYCPIKIIYE